MASRLIDKAIIVAAQAHHGQYRKGTQIPYITHPFAVGMLLAQAGCKEHVIAGGILHDTVEDTERTLMTYAVSSETRSLISSQVPRNLTSRCPGRRGSGELWNI